MAVMRGALPAGLGDLAPLVQNLRPVETGPVAERDLAALMYDAHETLTRLDPLWDELFPAEQARIMALLVERVDIDTDGLNVRLRVDGLSSLTREMPAGDIGEAA